MHLNDVGCRIEHRYYGLAEKFSDVNLDENIMPNHFHCIIIIADRRKGAPMCAPLSGGTGAAGLPERFTTLGEIVQWFKTMTTNGFIRGVKESGWPRFD